MIKGAVIHKYNIEDSLQGFAHAQQCSIEHP